MQWIIREPVDDTFDKIQEHSSLEQVAKTKSEELLDIGNTSQSEYIHLFFHHS